MIDKFAAIARTIRPIKPLFIGLSGACLLALAYVLLASPPVAQNQLLIPLVIGLLWSFSAWSFITNFAAIATTQSPHPGLFKRIKLRFLRAWYWMMALLFTATTLAALKFTNDILSVWYKN